MASDRRNMNILPRRTLNPSGFYSEEWDELQQKVDEWQVPDKQLRISQMVFCGGCLEIHPSGSGCISRSDTQHQGGGCSTWECGRDQKDGTDKYRPP